MAKLAHHDHDIAPDAETATDPVCGMKVEIRQGARSRDCGDETFQHGFLRFALQNRCAFSDLARGYNISDLHFDQIATAKLAVDGQIEQHEIAMVLGQFQSNSDRPDMLWLQRAFLTDDATFVPGRAKCANGR